MAQTIKGLAIQEPWIGLPLSGRKTWEMRSANAKYRGWTGLIRSKSGCVSGIARHGDVGDPLSLDQMVEAFDKHRIPEEKIRSEGFKWIRPWNLAEIRKLRDPVPYEHPNGAVLLFDLDPEASKAIFAQINDA